MSAVSVITGTTHGIGRVTSRELARAGYTVVMLCRNLAAAQAVREEILGQYPKAAVHVVHCDLSSLSSVRSSADTVSRRFEQIDVLINNAGMTSMRHRMSAEGFELTFATNYLGPFLLTALLEPKLSARARIVNVASRVHYRGRLNLDGIRNPRAPYGAQAAYAQSKLANVLHTFALARRLADTQVSCNCLHPGVVATSLLPRWLRIIKPLLSPQIVNAERGARTTLQLALAQDLGAVSGRYFDENGIAQPAAPLANDVQLQESLWAASARWVGITAN